MRRRRRSRLRFGKRRRLSRRYRVSRGGIRF